MKMVNKIVSLLLSIILVCSFAGCSNKSDNPKSTSDVSSFIFKSDKSVALEKPEKSLDAKKMFEGMKILPQMLHGNYRIIGGKEAEKKLPDEVGYYPDYKNSYGAQVSLLPFQIESGKHTFSNVANYIDGYNWAKIYFQTDKGTLDANVCAYTIEGNKIKFNVLSKCDYNKETSKITYALSDFSFEYEFKFVGLSIVFSKNGKSISMSSGLDTAGENYQFFANCYKSEGSESFDGIKNIYLKYNKDNTSITLEYDNGKTNRNCIAELTTDGLFTITIPNESGNKTYQFAMFYCESDGLILCDGEKTYYYNTNFSDQYSNKLENNLTIEDAKSLENMSKEKIEKILKEKENLAADLSAAFSSAGLNVDVDEVNGEISMDTSVLFGGDQAIITDAGKQLLNKFVGVYTSVVFNEKYNGFVSKIMVEGHTAPISGGTYESGLPLSEERANNVKAYCISSETGLNAANTNSLSSTMVSVGLSNSKPVKNEDNSVNMQASRRVSFRFIVNVK